MADRWLVGIHALDGADAQAFNVAPLKVIVCFLGAISIVGEAF